VDWLAHPIVVATYVAFLGIGIAGVKKLTGLFNRMDRVEEGVGRLEGKVDELGSDLRAHMDEEGKNVSELMDLIRSVHPDKE
jgi:hypothetical protein